MLNLYLLLLFLSFSASAAVGVLVISFALLIARPLLNLVLAGARSIRLC
jgi:hypothetical protein